MSAKIRQALIANGGSHRQSEFTIQDALNIQKQQLGQWALILKPEIMAYVQSEADRRNRLGYDKATQVWRGQDIDGWVHNNARQFASTFTT